MSCCSWSSLWRKFFFTAKEILLYSIDSPINDLNSHVSLPFLYLVVLLSFTAAENTQHAKKGGHKNSKRCSDNSDGEGEQVGTMFQSQSSSTKRWKGKRGKTRVSAFFCFSVATENLDEFSRTRWGREEGRTGMMTRRLRSVPKIYEATIRAQAQVFGKTIQERILIRYSRGVM